MELEKRASQSRGMSGHSPHGFQIYKETPGNRESRIETMVGGKAMPSPLSQAFLDPETHIDNSVDAGVAPRSATLRARRSTLACSPPRSGRRGRSRPRVCDRLGRRAPPCSSLCAGRARALSWIWPWRTAARRYPVPPTTSRIGDTALQSRRTLRARQVLRRVLRHMRNQGGAQPAGEASLFFSRTCAQRRRRSS